MNSHSNPGFGAKRITGVADSSASPLLLLGVLVDVLGTTFKKDFHLANGASGIRLIAGS